MAEQPPFGPEAEIEVGALEPDAELHASNRAAHRLAKHTLNVVLRETWLAVKYPEFYKDVRAYHEVMCRIWKEQ